jgi:hypothetical protein
MFYNRFSYSFGTKEQEMVRLQQQLTDERKMALAEGRAADAAHKNI